MKTPLSSSLIKAEAMRLGFDACGIARVARVDDITAAAFDRWIGEGRHAGMDYMTRYSDARYHPDSVLPGCRTIVSLALNYYPAHPLSDDQYQFAYYAYGRDYHDVMKARIRELARAIGLTAEYKESDERPSNSILFRVAVDSAPLLERYWAMQAGIGWIGRNHNLIVPHRGSFIVLGELLLTAEVDSYDQPIPNHCGTCHRCIEACPTCALTDSGVDASRCLSYLTIEHRGPAEWMQVDVYRTSPSNIEGLSVPNKLNSSVSSLHLIIYMVATDANVLALTISLLLLILPKNSNPLRPFWICRRTIGVA